MNWDQQEKSTIFKGKNWLYNTNKPENNSGSCMAESARKALIVLLVLLFLFLCGTIFILSYYYKYIYVEEEL
jgi:hypothetical protein